MKVATSAGVVILRDNDLALLNLPVISDLQNLITSIAVSNFDQISSK